MGLLQCLYALINNYKFSVQYNLLLLVITSVFMHFRLCMTSIKINQKKITINGLNDKMDKLKQQQI